MTASLATRLGRVQRSALDSALLRALTSVRLGLEICAVSVRDRLFAEVSARGIYDRLLSRSKAVRLASQPQDFRPSRQDLGADVLAGRLSFFGQTLDSGLGGDPWDMASPSQAFAAALHSFHFLPHLMATGEAGAEEALRLINAWQAEFQKVSPFVWDGEVLERRAYNLVCAAGALSRSASELENRRLCDLLARSARRLMQLARDPSRRADRLIVAAIIGAALAPPIGRKILKKALAQLEPALAESRSGEGGLKSRSPEAALERLYDLMTLDDALGQHGRALSGATREAFDDLGAAVRFYRLSDKRLCTFQGGGPSTVAGVTAALNLIPEPDPKGPPMESFGGFERLIGGSFEIMADAAPPGAGAFSTLACAQPLALEILCRGDRLITNCGWSPGGRTPAAFRLTDAGSTLCIHPASVGRLLNGSAAATLGQRLIAAAPNVLVERHRHPEGILLVMAHDGWADSFGWIHERRVYLDLVRDEVRGEDRLTPAVKRARQRPLPFHLHFHLTPETQVSMARDRRSFILRGKSNRGWRFRNDAPDVSIAPSTVFDAGVGRRSAQILLGGTAPVGDDEVRLRWKLSAVELKPEGPAAP